MHGRIYRKHRGVIFDLDGTLVDSRLDFAAMRRDLGLTADEPILEALASQPDDAARARLHQILLRHEYAGAEAATPMPGVLELISRLRQDGLKIGIFTRNAREVTVFKLHRLGLAVDDVIAREDAPPKPDPAGLLALCTAWAVGPENVVFVGDYTFDLDAGRNAGIKTLLYAPTPPDFPCDGAAVINTFEELWCYLE